MDISTRLCRYCGRAALDLSGHEASCVSRPRRNRGVCTYCHGNDRDVPCAYPSEGKPGCLRDARLKEAATAQP